MKKYVLVTGASKGIGLEIAKQLSFNGFNIVLTSRNRQNLIDAKEQLNRNLEHKIVEIDFSKDDIYNCLIKKIDKLPLVGIVHNYGINFHDTHPLDLEILQKAIYNNFFVSVKINNYLYKKLKGNPSKIVYISSTSSLHTKSSPSYVLSKSLINAYVKNSSMEYVKNNILICAVLPGIVAHKGSYWDRMKEKDYKKYEATLKKQPLNRFALPEDVAPYVVDIIKQRSLLLSGSLIKLDAGEY